MMFAQVVPIRRMPADRPWLTYLIPDGLEVVVGSLVSIPLRNSRIIGVVWEITDRQPAKMKIQSIRSVLFLRPIITAWQKRVIEILADTGSTSLGDVLWRVIPKLSAGRLTKLLKIQSHVNSNIERSRTGDGSFFWYRRRVDALDNLALQIDKSRHNYLAIVTPTTDDALEIVKLSEKLGRIAVHLNSKLSPTEYLSWYVRVLNNEPLVLVGNVFILALPFFQPPALFFDQEEHHAHKQTAQSPYYDTRSVFSILTAPVNITTPAPSIQRYRLQRPTIPPAPVQRSIISLHGPTQGPLVSEELLTSIDDAQQKGQRVICISPRRGFASYTACRACGSPLICPKCGRAATLFRGLADEARCQSCQTTLPLSATCKKCGSSQWSFHGLGVEQTTNALRHLRPLLNISPVVRQDILSDVAVDTYHAYRQIRSLPQVATVAIISGDSLLSLPDFSVAERAWQYLARLQAESVTAQILVQTWQPESTFWQRWLHGDDRAWYDDELHQRQRLKVPPYVSQWIASYRGADSLVNDKIHELKSRYHQLLQVKSLPIHRRQPSLNRLLITFASPAKEIELPWKTVFPLPWHLDRHPTSWID